MGDDKLPTPHWGVMVSSTVKDLEKHREAVIEALNGEDKLTPIVMEYDSAKPAIDVIGSSLQKVQEAFAYILVIGCNYGTIHDDSARNPNRLSLTELEFDEAKKLGLPILVFIMGDKHPVPQGDIERDPEKLEKLEAFREKAKRSTNSSVPGIYKVFNSLEEFTSKVTKSVADLRNYLDEQHQPNPTPESVEPKPTPANPGIPTPPEFYAEPPYIGNHDFVGRQAQLDILNDWANPADIHPILLFEAIGGTGKSMLTWHWVTKHARNIRHDWAGIFWYSFYERGAVMADFCRCALAYMTGQSLEELDKKKTRELSYLLLQELKSKPWLFILDGLERVLVSYHRIDAAQMSDEEAGKIDKIARRDPCDAIRPEDDDLLRSLTLAAPSKLLLTTRLTPKCLINQSSQPIPGIRREPLPGVRPQDAEELIRSRRCGHVTGTSDTIQSYLQRNCDCHPLVIGVIAGLVNNYFRDRGNFDEWAKDPEHGGHLNLYKLDLKQKHNHILNTAFDILPEKSRQLLSILALLSESVDYELLRNLNIGLLSEPEVVRKPKDPKQNSDWDEFSEQEKEDALKKYEDRLQQWQKYQEALKDYETQVSAAEEELPNTVRDLENRGLLQYDNQANRYDLHPVVRGVANGRLNHKDKERYGQPAVDYFFSQTRSNYDQVETLEEVSNELLLISTLLQMRRYRRASEAYSYELSWSLLFNLEAHNEILPLLKPFFPNDWGTIPDDFDIDSSKKGHLLNEVGLALEALGQNNEALTVFNAYILIGLQDKDWNDLSTGFANIFKVLIKNQNCFSKVLNICLLDIDLTLYGCKSKDYIFKARLRYFKQLYLIGKWEEAEAMWQLIEPMDRKSVSRALYRPGDAESQYAQFLFYQGKLQEEHLTHAEQLAKNGKNRTSIRYLHSLRGKWYLEQEEWESAARSFKEAVRMIHEVGRKNTTAEAFLALAKFHLNQLPEPQDTAEQLAEQLAKANAAHRPLAELWLAIANNNDEQAEKYALEQAKEHALAAYKWAWADGEPYVYRYGLNKARDLLERLNTPIPDLPPYDPAKDEELKLPWEDDVIAAVEELKAKAEAEKAKEQNKD